MKSLPWSIRRQVLALLLVVLGPCAIGVSAVLWQQRHFHRLDDLTSNYHLYSENRTSQALENLAAMEIALHRLLVQASSSDVPAKVLDRRITQKREHYLSLISDDLLQVGRTQQAWGLADYVPPYRRVETQWRIFQDSIRETALHDVQSIDTLERVAAPLRLRLTQLHRLHQQAHETLTARRIRDERTATAVLEFLFGILAVLGGGAGWRVLATISRSLESQQLAEQALRESEERLRQAVRLSHIGFVDHDHYTGAVYCSPEEREIYGWGADEPVTMAHFSNQTHPEDREAYAAAVRRAHDPCGGGLFDIERRIIRRDGEVRWLMTRSQTFFEGEGKARHPLRTIGAVLDITERKAAAQRSAQLEFALDHVRDAVYLLDEHGLFHYVNDGACRALGYSREELLGMRVKDIDAGIHSREWSSLWRAGAALGGPPIETRHRAKDGRVFPVEVTANHFEYEGRSMSLVLVRDISERKQAEQALRESEERVRQAVRVSHIGIFDHDHRTETIYCSPEARQIYGVREDQPLSVQTFIDQVHPEDREATAAAIRRAHDPSGDGSCDIERRIILPDGKIRWLSSRSHTSFDGGNYVFYKPTTGGEV